MADREAFERWFEDVFMDGMDTVGEWDAERNCYVVHQVHMAWKGWQAAIKRERLAPNKPQDRSNDPPFQF